VSDNPYGIVARIAYELIILPSALKMSGTSYRVDETYIKVGKSCKYLYRAVDKDGQTIEFMRERKARRFRGETVL
jgi:transposase-like protein